MKISETIIEEFRKDFKSCISQPRPGKFKRKQADAWMEGWIQSKGIWKEFGTAVNSYRFVQIVNKYYQ